MDCVAPEEAIFAVAENVEVQAVTCILFPLPAVLDICVRDPVDSSECNHCVQPPLLLIELVVVPSDDDTPLKIDNLC